MKEGKHTCNIREVNAERLEEFLIESLSRISKDSQYIQNLAFKLAHETPGYSRIELSSGHVKNIEDSVSQVLMDFKNGLNGKSQIEKCLIIRRTIEKITYKKDVLEVIISIKDKEAFSVSNGLDSRCGKMAARIRGGVPNPTAPAWRPTPTSSIKNNGAEGQNRTAHACLFRAALYH